MRDERNGLIGCVVMASGQASRFGGGKLLASLGGRSVLSRTLACVKDQPGLEVKAASIFPQIREEAVRCGVPCVIPEGPALSDTIRAGLSGEWTERWAGCLFLPGDQPLIRPETIRNMILLFLEDCSAPVRLSWEGKAASPVLFPARMFGALQSLSGEQGGNVLLKGRSDVRLCEAKYEWELWDIDTPGDLARIGQMPLFS